MPFLTLNRLERKRLSVFLSSLLLAIFAWLFFALSNRYLYTIKVKINYTDPPVHKAYHPLHDDTLTLNIEGSGWQLLFSRIRLHPTVLNISLKSLENKNYIALSNQIADLNRQLEAGQEVVDANPDTLFFDFSPQILKKVPVKLLYQLSFKELYGISGPIRISPDSVIISGAAKDLKNIKFWPSEVLTFTDVSSTFSTKVALKDPGNTMEIMTKHVKAEFPVDEFTEKVVEVPIKLINNKSNEVLFMPEKVKVTILTALKNYAAIEKDSFKANINFEGWLKYKYAQLPVSFSKLPAYTKIIKVEPQVVDFVVEQQ